MSRMIDADALMQSLGITDMDCDKCEWHDNEWNDCKRGGEFEDACCAIENAPTITPEPQWIPCSERLPDVYRRYYLVSLADKKEVDIAYYTEYGTWETFRNDEVEAWMPLPEPWRGES